MRELILVTGGSGSGKSEYAEQEAIRLHKQKKGHLWYVATMKSNDRECDTKIEIHRQRRENTAFETIEKPVRIGEIAVQEGDVILLECISNLLANEMFSKEGRGEGSSAAILEDIDALRKMCDLVIVSNEVSGDGTVYDVFTMEYIRCITGINRDIAARATRAYEVVVGIPVCLK